MKVKNFLTQPGFLCAWFLVGFVQLSVVSATEILDTTMRSRDVLAPAYFRSVHYEIEELARRTEYFHEFTVRSDFGIYKVSSQTMLDRRIEEITIMAGVMPQLTKSGLSLAESIAGRRGVASEDVTELFANPLGTAAKLIDNLAYNLEETLTQDPLPDVEQTERGRKNRDPDPHRRSAAAQLGVDVYSSNGALQGILDELAAARSAGRLRQSVAPLQAPLVAPPVFGSGVLDTRIRSKLKNFSSAEINGEVDGRLNRLGVSTPTRVRLLSHPSFTPRSRLYLTNYIGVLKSVTGRELIANAAIRATTEADAAAFVNLARMAAFYQLAGSSLREVIMRSNYPLFIGANNSLVLMLPVDYFAWTERNLTLVTDLSALAAAQEAKSISLLLAGTFSDLAKQELSVRGFEQRERYSF